MSAPSWHACAAIVERGDPPRFRAAMAAPAEVRAVLFPIYAANVEISRAPWVTQEPMIAEMRLQWWRDVMEEIVEGREVRRHEVATPLAAVLSKAGAEALDQLIAARRWDIYKDAFEDEAAFMAYLEDTAGGLLFAACDALGTADRLAAKDAGYAAGLAGFFQAIPALEAAKRVPLLDGRNDAIAALAHGALSRLKSARKSRAKLAKEACISLWHVEPILRQAAHDPSAVGEGRLEVPAFKSSLRLSKAALLGRW
ncbi:MAG: squalene/phytoene synthase family protein [Planktotalea sp.]|uniref:squalene/phytoene synthase family protein n=1 Tax=Planktotalea sp. TaxID=2029877 RepID=UPI003C73A94D